MTDNGSISLLFLLNLLLYFIAGEINLLLGFVHIHADVLLLIFFGLYIRRTGSFFCIVLMGLMAEAARPVPVGTYLIGYLALWSFFVWCQRRIQRHNPGHIRTVALIGQNLWLTTISIFLAAHQWNAFAYWLRILLEMVLSGLLVYFVSWPWCRLQQRILHNLGWNLEARFDRL